LLFGEGESSATLSFEEVHDVEISFAFTIATDAADQGSFWLAIGNEESEPVRLGIHGQDLYLHDGAQVQLLNRSIHVSPGGWHTITIEANVDADRWTVSFDGDKQTRLPNAVEPSSFSHIRFTRSLHSWAPLEGTGHFRRQSVPSVSWAGDIEDSLGNPQNTGIWIDNVLVKKDWSHIPLNEAETMLYYKVAKRYPQVNMLMWWEYTCSFASSLLSEKNDYQVTDVWAVQREIWEKIKEREE
jgi:hypothetical protein